MAAIPYPGCGYDLAQITPGSAVERLAAMPGRYRAAVAPLLYQPDGDDLVRRRPAPDVWSPLEYLAHIADCYDMLIDGVVRAQAGEEPFIGRFDPGEQDRLMITEAHNARPLEDVLARVEAGARRAAEVAATIGDDDWARVVRFPTGSYDVLLLVRSIIHEADHHVGDIERQVTAAR